MLAEIIRAFPVLKKAVANTNLRIGSSLEKKCELISKVCYEILEGKPADDFSEVVWQTGPVTHSFTRKNMKSCSTNYSTLNN
jgi:fumarate hydratase, class II